MRKSDLAAKIQLLSNRVRCSECNADSSEALFIISDELIFRASFMRPRHNLPPAFLRGKPKKLRLNRVQNLEPSSCLVRLCIRCGNTRKTGIPNN